MKKPPPPIQKKPQLVKKVHWCVWFIVWSIANAYTWKILICFLTLIKETLIYSINAAEFIKSGHYKRMPRVTVGETRWRTLTAQWPWVPSIGHNLKPFTGKGDVFIWVKNSRLGRKTQTNKETYQKWNMTWMTWVYLYKYRRHHMAKILPKRN